MNIEKLKNVATELRNQYLLVTESFDLPRYSEIEFFIDKYKKTLDNRKVGSDFKRLKLLEKRLKLVQKKCSEDNDFAKKTVLITRTDLIKNLVTKHIDVGKTICSFSEKNFKTPESCSESSEKVASALKKLSAEIDSTFSFKDEYQMHFVVSEFLNMLKLIKKSGYYFDVIEVCYKNIYLDEKDIDIFNSSPDTDDDDGTLVGLKLTKMSGMRGFLNTYFSYTVSIYMTLFSMIDTFTKHYYEEVKI